MKTLKTFNRFDLKLIIYQKTRKKTNINIDRLC